MARLFVILPVIAAGMLIFAVIDLIRIENERVRGIPKAAWVVIVVLLPIIGPLLWFIIGRERFGRVRAPGPAAPVAPDDDPAFLTSLGRDREQEERIRRLEQELSELDDDASKD
jgi:hypothetical protein